MLVLLVLQFALSCVIERVCVLGMTARGKSTQHSDGIHLLLSNGTHCVASMLFVYVCCSDVCALDTLETGTDN